jgi:flagellar biosynthesis GTPase FlhF
VRKRERDRKRSREREKKRKEEKEREKRERKRDRKRKERKKERQKEKREKERETERSLERPRCLLTYLQICTITFATPPRSPSISPIVIIGSLRWLALSLGRVFSSSAHTAGTCGAVSHSRSWLEASAARSAFMSLSEAERQSSTKKCSWKWNHSPNAVRICMGKTNNSSAISHCNCNGSGYYLGQLVRSPRAVPPILLLARDAGVSHRITRAAD